MTELYLAVEFFKTGLFAVGGGLATIPFLKDIAERYDWYTSAELVDMIAIGESTPGPIGVNMATYTGINAAGFIGGIIATLSLVMPCVIVVMIISRFLTKFRESELVGNVFYALRPASAALIASAIFPVLISSVINLTDYNINIGAIIMYAVFFPLCFLNNARKKPIHPLIFIAAGAVVGIAFGDYLDINIQ